MTGAIVIGNLLLVAAVAFLVIHPSQSDATAPPAQADNAVATAQVSTLDQLASASIAETAAQMTGLGETVAVTNQADTEQALMSQASVSDDSLSSKPQVIASAYKSNKDIKLYVVQSGDTIAKIADRFGVTSDSIRWSNNLSGNSVKAGTKLKIPPVDGIVYTVKKGDTPDTLAAKYDIPKAQIVQYNDAELHGLTIGELIILPGASKASQVARSTSRSLGSSSYHQQPVYGYNGYDFGYCTWWVATLRQRAGNPLPAGLGNASSWPYWARVFGLPTGTTPRVGAAAVVSTVGEGHVAYVTAVDGPNTITVSEMNHAGWDVEDTRTLTGNFFYIY